MGDLAKLRGTGNTLYMYARREDRVLDGPASGKRGAKGRN